MTDITALIEQLRSKATDCHVSEETLYLQAAEALSRLSAPLPDIRCDKCDNGLEDMTTARDVIAKAICWGSGWATRDQCSCSIGSECAYYTDADAVISALRTAPDSVREELAVTIGVALKPASHEQNNPNLPQPELVRQTPQEEAQGDARQTTPSPEEG